MLFHHFSFVSQPQDWRAQTKNATASRSKFKEIARKYSNSLHFNISFVSDLPTDINGKAEIKAITRGNLELIIAVISHLKRMSLRPGSSQIVTLPLKLTGNSQEISVLILHTPRVFLAEKFNNWRKPSSFTNIKTRKPGNSKRRFT